jgi:hypothetical protein
MIYYLQSSLNSIGKAVTKKEHEKKQPFPNYKTIFLNHFSSFRPLLLSKLITFSSLVQIKPSKVI